MEQIIIAIGTNVSQEKMMMKAKERLRHAFTGIVFSKEMWTKPIGMESDMFLNCIAVTSTTLCLDEIAMLLKGIETECGNTKALRSEDKVLIDLDLLQYGTSRMHVNDWERPYIKELMEYINDKHNT